MATKLKIFNLSQVIALLVWLFVMLALQKLPDFVHHGFMSITMLFGSFVAGATSEGGGAVAYPVMTLFFDIPPSVARDFSLAIQSVGMLCATFYIYIKRIPIAPIFLRTCLVGSLVGQVFAFYFLEGYFSPVDLKISFVSIFMGFAMVLFLHLRPQKSLGALDVPKSLPLQILLLFFAAIGGVLTALLGNGIDILTFALAVLLLNISEKRATATSVVLMGFSALIGVVLKILIVPEGIAMQAIDYWLVAVPVVIFGAPLGALFMHRTSRYVVIIFLQCSVVFQFFYAWIILPLDVQQKQFSILLIALSLLLFMLFKIMGRFAIWSCRAK